MCTAAACVQWNSTVYTYHIHLISLNEISADLLFTMHREAAAAWHGAAHTDAHSDTHTHTSSITASAAVTVSAAERQLIVFCKLPDRTH